MRAARVVKVARVYGVKAAGVVVVRDHLVLGVPVLVATVLKKFQAFTMTNTLRKNTSCHQLLF